MADAAPDQLPVLAGSGAPAPRTGLERIDAAIARIEAAVAARSQAADALARRHAALKSRMGEAVAALDDVIARGTA